MGDDTSIYDVLGGILVVLLLFWLVGSMISPSQATSAPPAVSPATRLRQQHPDWPTHYCQQIADGIVSTGMTKEMVIQAWGNPEQQFASGNKEFLSYPYTITVPRLADYSCTCQGIRQVVSLENNTVTGIATMNLYKVNLNNYIGWSKQMISLFFGPPSSVDEHSSGDVWIYEIEGFCAADALEKGIKQNTVFLYFTPGGQVASWSRYGG